MKVDVEKDFYIKQDDLVDLFIEISRVHERLPDAIDPDFKERFYTLVENYRKELDVLVKSVRKEVGDKIGENTKFLMNIQEKLGYEPIIRDHPLMILLEKYVESNNSVNDFLLPLLKRQNDFLKRLLFDLAQA